jgi:hypothetical protein
MELSSAFWGREIMMQYSRHSLFLLGIIALFLATMACSLSGGAQTQDPPGLDQTRIALAVEQTSVANDKATIQARDAVTATQASTQTQAPTETTAPPTSTIEPTLALPSATAEPPTATATLEPTPTVDIEAQIRSANILVYEDMAGNYDRKPLIHQAISEMNFSGGKVIEVSDALGKFKEELINTADWDLILVGAEYRSGVQGEFWKYVYDQINRGAAVVMEVWYLDKHYTDIQPIFSQCGIKYQKNWGRGPDYNMLDYAVYWLQPDHPFFQSPQVPVSLGNPNFLYWVPPLTEDAGDLIQLSSGGDAVLLGGSQPGSKSNYGLLATCMQGTVIVQTFSTHDYKSIEAVNMWKNYMRYTLTNHFAQEK